MQFAEVRFIAALAFITKNCMALLDRHNVACANVIGDQGLPE